MKRITKNILVALMAIFTLTTVFSCDKPSNGGDDLTGWEKYTAGWTEEGDKLIYKQSFENTGGYTQILIFEFKNDRCIKATGEFIWSSAEFASIYYNALPEDIKPHAKLSGKKVIIDFTDDYRDLSKSTLKAAIDATDQWITN